MKKLFFCLVLTLWSVAPLMAVPAKPQTITHTQPDGTVVEVLLNGDEHSSYLTTPDGYLLTRADSGYFEYARLDADCNIVATGIKATSQGARTSTEKQYLLTAPTVELLQMRLDERRAVSRQRSLAPQAAASPKAFPLTGSPKSLVILAEFSDNSFSTDNPVDDFTRKLNEKGYSDYNGFGSARDFFLASSNDQFNPEFVVVGPVKLPNTIKYYGEHIGNSNDKDAVQMIIDACEAADELVNFADYDTDKNGTVDNIFVYYAGYNEAEGGGSNTHTIWPHRSTVWKKTLMLDGVKVYDYACTSELRGVGGKTQCGIGTFCHEFGHVLGLPDLYDTDNKRPAHQTVGRWDIMDQGSYTNDGCSPPTYSSYARFSLGWLKPEVLEEGASCALEPLITSNKAYLVSPTGSHNMSSHDPNPSEFFMIENRRSEGMDTYSLPGEGLLITRINYVGSDWNNNVVNNDPDKMGVEIMCAAATTANPEANVFPGPHNVTSCELELRSGEALPTPITGIEEAGDVTSFFYGFDPTAPFISFDGKALKSFDAEFGKTQPTQIVDLSGVRLVDDVDVYFNYLSRTKFRVRVYDPDAEEQEFAKEIALVPGADSTVNVKLEIQFAPTELSHNEPVEDVLVIRTGNIKKVFPITGYSRVPNNIYPTVAYDAAEVSPYSFVASWKPVEPATGYYLSVYSITDEPFSDVESFDGFDNGAPEGWEATFSTTATTAATAPAALFTLAADTLFTKEYFMPLDGLSYWRHSNNSAGTLLVDALNAAGVWENIWKEDFDATTRGRQVTVSLADTAEYRRFKVYVEFKSAGGGLSFDNFSAEFSKKISYVYDNGYVASPDTSFLVGGLAQGTLYNYSVVATQWEAKSGSQDKLYEYLSDPSNIVGVSTVEGEPEESRYMTITRAADGFYHAFVPQVEENHALFIYGTDGHCVDVLESAGNEFIIPELVHGKLYILKYAEKGNQKRKTKIGKLLYLR